MVTDTVAAVVAAIVCCVCGGVGIRRAVAEGGLAVLQQQRFWRRVWHQLKRRRKHWRRRSEVRGALRIFYLSHAKSFHQTLCCVDDTGGVGGGSFAGVAVPSV